MRVIDSARLKLLVATAFGSAVALAFLLSVQTETPASPQPSLVFSHSQHTDVTGLSCTDCHRPSSAGAVTLVRPDHASCNTCHEDWFDPQTPRKEFCTVCHTAISEDQLPELKRFPDYNKDTAILFDFSHKQHLQLKGQVTQIVGARVDCNHCHSIEPGGEKATFPAHTECAVCHDQPDIKPRLSADSTNQDCMACHQSGEQKNPAYRKLRRFIVDPSRSEIIRGTGALVDVSNPQMTSGNTMQGRDLKFSHEKHLTDSRNAGIACETCHINIDQKTSISQLNIPSMWDCTICHESRRTRAEFRIDNCSVCHTAIGTGRKPRNHTLTERPYDHTAAFRTRHAEAARAPEAKCAFCHEMTTDTRFRIEGVARTEERYHPAGGNCDDCHSVMKPKSHTVRWRNDLHGRMAALNRVNCATCHQPDFCIRCHNVRPRSHTPLNAFVNGGHRLQAQVNQRSCFTCHTYSETCERCHSPRIR